MNASLQKRALEINWLLDCACNGFVKRYRPTPTYMFLSSSLAVL